jgi:hypothetical protein
LPTEARKAEPIATKATPAGSRIAGFNVFNAFFKTAITGERAIICLPMAESPSAKMFTNP